MEVRGYKFIKPNSGREVFTLSGQRDRLRDEEHRLEYSMHAVQDPYDNGSGLESQRDTDKVSGARKELVNKIYQAVDDRNDLQIAQGSWNDTELAQNLTHVLADHGERSWRESSPIQIPNEHLTALASLLVKSSGATSQDTIVLTCNQETVLVAAEVWRICEERGITVRLDPINTRRDAVFAKNLPDAELGNYANDRLQLFEGVTRHILVMTNPDPDFNPDAVPGSENRARLAAHYGKLSQRAMAGEMHYTLTRIPTERDASLEEMSLDAALTEYLEAVNQPWSELSNAQLVLKAKLDQATTIHITNDDGTDVTFDIRDMTFANSVVQKNIPGSELFSAPQREGVNGKIVAKGRFQYGSSGIIEDISLTFDTGKITEATARVGQDALLNIISRDDNRGQGSRFLGEIAFGTNPHLRRHTVNALLVEKVGGSFHVAIGGCYRYEKYDGEPVKLMNGNISASHTHWDVTTMLRGKEGVVSLSYPDGSTEVVQQNGKWLVSGCEVLNLGWGAINSAERPHWWNERYPNGYID